MVIDEGRIVAEGKVRVERGEETLAAERVELDGDQLLLIQPAIRREGVSATAASASGSLDALLLTDLYLNPCACCATAPWSIQAQHAELRDDRVVWRRGWFEVAGHPVLPVPWGRLPLSAPKVVPGLPILGRGPDGFQVALPLTLYPSEALSVALVPELRVERGPRLSAELQKRQGESQSRIGGSAAYDLNADALRGAAWGDIALAVGPVQGGAEGQWVGDAAWIADYGASLMDRQVPWTRQRGWVGAGPVRLDLLGWQLEPPTITAIPSLVVSDVGRSLGPLRADSVARLDWVYGAPRVEIGESVAISARPGPFLLGFGADGRAFADPDRQTADGQVEAEALLQLWGQHGPIRHELSAGVRGGIGVGAGDPTPLAIADPLGLARGGLRPGAVPALAELHPGPRLGPALVSTWIGPATRVRVAVDAPWSPTLGPGLGATVQARRGPLRVAASGAGNEEGWFGAANTALEGERGSVALAYVGERGVARVDQLRAHGALDLRTDGGTWTPSAAIVARPDAIAGWEAGLLWEASCACASLGASLAFAEDRAGPQIAASVSLRPGGR